jgi:hypothetical protein
MGTAHSRPVHPPARMSHPRGIRSRRTRSRQRRGWHRLCASATVLVLLVVLVPGAVGAAGLPSSPARITDPRLDLLAPPGTGLVPVPAQDPFYAVPTGIAGLPNGTVLASRRVQAMALGTPIPAAAWQVKYKTIDQRGNPSAFVTTVLVPLTPWPGPGLRPLLSYQVAVDALSTKCAPSYVMRAGLTAALTGGPTVLASNAASETANILQAVQRGFTVAVPDWEGPAADWVGDSGAAHGVLDGIRAVMGFAPAGVAPSARIGLIGYSGGALATDWAIQIQPAYAPSLRFAGTALGGTPASFPTAIADFAANAGARAAIPLLLAAFERSYPSWNLGQYLSAAGRTAVANSQNDCLADALIRYAGVDPTVDEAYPGAIFSNPRLDALLASVSLIGYPGVPRTPILFYHSTHDELADIAKMRELAARYCAEGVTVHIETSPAGDHIAYVLTGFPTALSYIADRFAGQAAPDDCRSTTTGPRARPPLSHLRISPHSFRATERGTGATISYRESTAGLVRLTVVRLLAGERLNGRCVTLRRQYTGARRRFCTQSRRVGTLVHAGPAGRVSLHFSGRFGGRPLTAGRYELIARPRGGSTVTAMFVVL